jgi:hypothetical protein
MAADRPAADEVIAIHRRHRMVITPIVEIGRAAVTTAVEIIVVDDDRVRDVHVANIPGRVTIAGIENVAGAKRIPADAAAE